MVIVALRTHRMVIQGMSLATPHPPERHLQAATQPLSQPPSCLAFRRRAATLLLCRCPFLWRPVQLSGGCAAGRAGLAGLCTQESRTDGRDGRVRRTMQKGTEVSQRRQSSAILRKDDTVNAPVRDYTTSDSRWNIGTLQQATAEARNYTTNDAVHATGRHLTTANSRHGRATLFDSNSTRYMATLNASERLRQTTGDATGRCYTCHKEQQTPH